MPIYEYQCSKCSHHFEMIHGVAEKEQKILCPKCGDSRIQRMISSFSCGGLKESEAGPVAGCGPKPGRFS
ncbi:MAG: zinc ribbon domain-containing protein [Deltaproteobacteria bacterium]|nr:zinc ribbon domain-containing protein [Deltaproteobacteria bacterium]